MSTPRTWFSIKNAAESQTAEVFIYDEIGGWGVTPSDFIAQLRELSGKALTVRIHSPGGSITDGLAIYNALLRHKGGISTQIDGLAASMASIIALAGKPVRMAENSFYMIHNPAAMVWGGSEDMRQTADLIDKMRDVLVNIYVAKTGMDAAAIEGLMDAETWLTAAEAKAQGFIDEITDAAAITNSVNLSKFKRPPSALVDTPSEGMSDISTLSASLATAQSQAVANHQRAETLAAEMATVRAELVNLTAARESLVTAHATALADLNTSHATALADLRAQIRTPEQLNAEVARVVAAQSHSPVEGEGNSNPSNQEQKKPELFGLARAQAAYAEQLKK